MNNKNGLKFMVILSEEKDLKRDSSAFGFRMTSLLSILMISLLAFAGCVNLKKKFPDIKTYDLNIERTEKESPAAYATAVQINPFSAVGELNRRFFVYRTGENRYEEDFYNQTFIPPADMVTEDVSVWLSASPLVRYVLDEALGEDPVFTIDGKVLELYGDYRDEKSPRAQLALQLTVREVAGKKTSTRFQKTYSRAVSMERISAANLIEGWNTALEQVLTEFEHDFESVVTARNK
jgi:cholesterol transport system auxiliary component